MKVAKVKLLGPVNHDGKSLAEGDVVELPVDAATALIEAKAAEAVSAKKGASEAAS